MRNFDRRALLTSLGLGILGSSALGASKAQATPSSYASEVRLHFIAPDPIWRSQDSIVIEVRDAAGNTSFGLIDGGYGTTWATDEPNYVNRYVQGDNYNPDRLANCCLATLDYLDTLGINSDNTEFYLGTHPHSDHIGISQELILAYRPKVVYTPEYKDEYLWPDPKYRINTDGEIFTGLNLYDNLYYYDRLVAAAQAIGVPLVTEIDARLGEPTLDSNVAGPCFSVGDVRFEIMNYDTFYKSPEYAGSIGDCNDFCWGLKITANGRTVFLGGDINNTWGAEDRLARELGHVDVLKLGHHGQSGSSTANFLRTLSPAIAIQTGYNSAGTQEKLGIFENETGTRWFTTHDADLKGLDALIVTIGADGSLTTNLDGKVCAKTTPSDLKLLYIDGRQAGGGWHYIDETWYWTNGPIFNTGWTNIDGTWYHFEWDGVLTLGWVDFDGRWYYMKPSRYWATDSWIRAGDDWYYCGPTGAATVGWFCVKDIWYRFDENGIMLKNQWVWSGGSWYYLGASGAMQTAAWAPFEDKWYWLGSDGKVQTNAWAPYNGKWYWLGPDGLVRL